MEPAIQTIKATWPVLIFIPHLDSPTLACPSISVFHPTGTALIPGTGPYKHKRNKGTHKMVQIFPTVYNGF